MAVYDLRVWPEARLDRLVPDVIVVAGDAYAAARQPSPTMLGAVRRLGRVSIVAMAEAAAFEVLDVHVPTRAVGAVEAEVDGEKILLSPSDFSYFGLAGAGAPVWELVDGERSVGQIVARLQSDFAETDGETIRAESLEFIEALAAAGLVELK